MEYVVHWQQQLRAHHDGGPMPIFQRQLLPVFVYNITMVIGGEVVTLEVAEVMILVDLLLPAVDEDLCQRRRVLPAAAAAPIAISFDLLSYERPH
jgi:hypothetical protein